LDQLLIYLPLLIVVAVANLAERHRGKPYHLADPQLDGLVDPALRYATPVLLALLNITLLGLAALATLAAIAGSLAPLPAEGGVILDLNWSGAAAITLATGLLGFLPLLRPIRARLARWLSIEPGSPVHTTALVLALYQIGGSLAQLVLIGDLETLAATGLILDAWDVLLSGLPLLIFALLGVGAWIRRDTGETAKRLGLLRPTWRQLVAVPVIVALLLAFDYGVSTAWETLDPESYRQLEAFTDLLFGELTTVTGALVLGLSAGISEELLFRGAVQPRLGLLLATLLFAIGHIQYGITPATGEVFVIGLVLGLVRNRTNTTVAILVHAGYNAVGTLLEMI
jgi:membrane protease YdiL (CAAX protease family)